jgi:hypothetical protein
MVGNPGDRRARAAHCGAPALAGRAPGVEAEQLLAPARPAATRPSPARQAPSTAGRQPATTDSEPGWLVAAAASWTFDGETKTGLLSVGPGVGVGVWSWRASVSGELVGIASSIQSQGASLILRRSFLLATLGPVFAPSAAANLVPQQRRRSSCRRRLERIG